MDHEYELQTHRAEDRHWWYRGRRKVIERTLARLGPLPATSGLSSARGGPTPATGNLTPTTDGLSPTAGADASSATGGRPPAARILDAGCGSGRNMVELARHGTVTGVELSQTSVGLARARAAGEVIEGSVLEMPFDPSSFDLAVSLDVIEHLEDDLGALRELRRVVAPGGALLVTVPAYQWLWSGHDEINRHHRRYTRRSLLAVAERAGWECARTTYFNSLLLPMAIPVRVLERLSTKTTESSLDLWIPPGPLNWLLERPLAIEAAVIGRGGRIPAGLSLLAVFR